ncbi:MAG: LysE family translocator, partial [Desulfuromonadales bacterium]|nr:LysE family translocator [Desulfuromonadales bacterium]
TTGKYAMIPLDTLLAFFCAALILCLAPGPDNLFVLTQSALSGRAAGVSVTLGLCTGLIGHTIAVTCGVAALIQTSATAFTVLKLCGAIYLLYLAWQAWRAPSTELKSVGNGDRTFSHLYRRGILMNITNPKVSIFFLAFLPQFTDPARGSVAFQLALLGVIFIVATILVFGSVALLAGSLRRWLKRSSGAQTVMNRIAGTVFGGLAVKLALTKQ